MGQITHVICAYCGSTRGYEWVTGGRFGKIYCSRDCRNADLVWTRVCLTIPLYVMIFYFWTEFYYYPYAFVLPLAALLYAILPIGIALRGMAAKERVSQRP